MEKQAAIALNSEKHGKGMDQDRGGYEQVLRKAIWLAESSGGLQVGGTGTAILYGDCLGRKGDYEAEDMENYHLEALLSQTNSHDDINSNDIVNEL